MDTLATEQEATPFPELSIAKIAQELGYTDDSTFYRNFLQLTGMTPSQFRKQCAREQSE